MTSSDARLLRQLEDEMARVHPELVKNWEIDSDALTCCRIASPVEPCEQCGRRVYLILVGGEPRWVRLGAVIDNDSLFPRVEQVLHECGDGGAWSVEAALFTAETLVEWGFTR